MARLTEEMVIARSRQSDLSAVKTLNLWGAELGDVTLLRHMPNVEVVALSLNKIRGLGDFARCRRLRELYMRKNEIADLRELRHLRRLRALAVLWLDENPCAAHPEYRLTVLRNLPHLQKLDNVPVQPEEVAQAARRGRHIPDSDDEDYPQEMPTWRAPEPEPAGPELEPAGPEPERAGPEPERAGPEPAPPHAFQRAESPPRRGVGGGRQSPESDERSERSELSERSERSERYERHEQPAMTRSYHERRGAAPARSPEPPAAALRPSRSAHSVQEYAYAGCECRCDCRCDCRCGSRGEASPGAAREPAERDGARDFPSAVMGERRGFPRRPVARNSNLLSAVLCLLKELDYPSLEVAELAVRCRMDELASAQ